MKIALVGAGAIGCWLGARLARQSQTPITLSVLARGESLHAIQAQGVQLSIAGQTLQAPVHASDKAAELGVQDLVLVALKAPALSEVAAQLTPLMGPHTVVLTAMNGVPWWFLQGQKAETGATRLHTIDPDGVIERAIPATQVLGCVVHASCALLGRGHAKHHFGNGLIVGEPMGGRSDRAERTVALLCAAGFDATLIAARAELDGGKRKAMYSELANTLRDTGGLILPMFNDFVAAKRDEVGGWFADPNGEMMNGRALAKCWLNA